METDPYKALGLAKDASPADINKAYRSLALVYHPDKSAGDPHHAEKYALVLRAYQVLSDPDAKALYDETGTVPEDKGQGGVGAGEIARFAKDYKNGPQEDEDLVDFYNKFKGNVRTILDWIPLAEAEDVDRLISRLKELIEEKRIARYPSFEPSCKALRQGQVTNEDGSIKIDENFLRTFQKARERSGAALLKRLARQVRGGTGRGVKRSAQRSDSAPGSRKRHRVGLDEGVGSKRVRCERRGFESSKGAKSKRSSPPGAKSRPLNPGPTKAHRISGARAKHFGANIKVVQRRSKASAKSNSNGATRGATRGAARGGTRGGTRKMKPKSEDKPQGSHKNVAKSKATKSSRAPRAEVQARTKPGARAQASPRPPVKA